MNAKSTYALNMNSTNQESQLLEINLRELSIEEFASVAGGAGSQDTPPSKP